MKINKCLKQPIKPLKRARTLPELPKNLTLEAFKNELFAKFAKDIADSNPKCRRRVQTEFLSKLRRFQVR